MAGDGSGAKPKTNTVELALGHSAVDLASLAANIAVVEVTKLVQEHWKETGLNNFKCMMGSCA